MTKPRQTTLQIDRQIIVEEFAALDREVENYRPRIQRYEKLRQLILDWYPDVAPEEEITVPGVQCDILITSRDNVRSVSMEGKSKLFKLWGPRGFLTKCSVMLKSLPDPKDPESLYTVQALTGPRHLHVMIREVKTST